MEKVLLFKTGDSKQEKRDLYLTLSDNSELILDGCDSGPSVKDYYGDFDYEYAITLSKEKKVELFNYLKKKKIIVDIPGDELDPILKEYILKEYSHEEGFLKFQQFLDKHGIEYSFWSYV